MKLMNVTVLLSALFATASVFAADAAPSADDAKKAEMMKKWQEASTPGAAHAALAPMVGSWTYTAKHWETADGKPHESKGTSKMKLVLGGRFLQHEVKGTAMGMPFEGLGYTGYDNVKGKYDTLWLDNFSTGVMHGTGSFDAATQTLADSGEYSCPMSDSKSRAYRTEMKLVSKNSMVYTMYGPGLDGSKEFKQMELSYTRAKK